MRKTKIILTKEEYFGKTVVRLIFGKVYALIAVPGKIQKQFISQQFAPRL
jgi:hypothetical protein